jgi:hypothetical protein
MNALQRSKDVDEFQPDIKQGFYAASSDVCRQDDGVPKKI